MNDYNKVTVIITKSIFDLNGSAQSTQDMIRSIIKSKKKLIVISLDNYESANKSFFTKSELENMELLNFHYPLSILNFFKTNNLKDLLFNLYWVFKYPLWRFRFNNRLNNLNCDFLILNNISCVNIYNRINFKKIMFKILLIRESSEIYKLKNIDFSFDTFYNLFQEFDKYIFVSSNVRDNWVKFLNLDILKTFYIPNTIKENISNKLINNEHIESKISCDFNVDKKTILCLASLQYHKGQDVLIKASKILWNKNINNFEVVFMGNSTNDKNGILKIINKLSKNYPIKYLRERNPNEAMQYISACDILILPSRTEAMPRVILEAMSLKKIIIASNVGGVPELISNNENGLLFSSENFSQLSSIIEKVLNNFNNYGFLADAAHNRYWKMFSNLENYRNWNSFFKSMN
tara:strand:+ start:724 stop:1941 length:1218 start_codon:yes stop_codon:yes gene_type:complete